MQLLAGAGGPGLETVRLSQTKGPAVRAMVIEAYRTASKDATDAPGEAVGYARVQQVRERDTLPGNTPHS